MGFRKPLLVLFTASLLVGCGDTSSFNSTTTSQTSNPTPATVATLSELPEDAAIVESSVPEEVTWEAAALGYVPGEVVVQYRPQADSGSVRHRRGIRAKQTLRRTDSISGQGQLEVASVAAGRGVEETVADLVSDPAVQYAEPNWIYSSGAVSTDPYFTNGSLWGMGSQASGSAFGCQANLAWAKNHTGAATVYVGVLDEGVLTGHSDLSGSFGNPKEKAGDGKDNDGNGYKDDTLGWDFLNNDKTVYDGPADDHGTHVAGTIGARANKTGVVGVSWKVKLISGKFLGPNGGTSTGAVKAIDYMIDLKKKRGLNIVAINASWGGPGYSQALKDAITRARDADILFVCAAGNNGTNNDTSPAYPASYEIAPTQAKPYDNIISVAALTSSGEKASFSNYGAVSVDLAAPGAGIWSTVPTSTGGSAYASWSGTSMATPHVTGAVALYKSTYPNASAAAVRTAVLSAATATPTAGVGSASNAVATGGRLNVAGF